MSSEEGGQLWGPVHVEGALVSWRTGCIVSVLSTTKSSGSPSSLGPMHHE